MNTFELLRKALLYTTTAAVGLAGVGIAATPLAAQGQKQDEELQMGQEVSTNWKPGPKSSNRLLCTIS